MTASKHLAIAPLAIPISPSGPRYIAVLRAIERAVVGGDLPAGTHLPSERDLSRAYGISRLTLRRALDELVRAGRLRKVHGVGTFVAEQRLELDDRLSFSERVRQVGREPATRVLSIGTIPATKYIAGTLRTQLNEPVICLDRIRLIDGVPVMREITHLSAKRYGGLLGEDLGQNSLYRLLHEHYGIQIAEVQETIEAHLIGAADALLLACEAGAPGFKRLLVAFDTTGEPVELCEGLAVGSRTKYRFALRVGRDPHAEVAVGYPVEAVGGRTVGGRR